MEGSARNLLWSNYYQTSATALSMTAHQVHRAHLSIKKFDKSSSDISKFMKRMLTVFSAKKNPLKHRAKKTSYTLTKSTSVSWYYHFHLNIKEEIKHFTCLYQCNVASYLECPKWTFHIGKHVKRLNRRCMTIVAKACRDKGRKGFRLSS